MNYKKSVYRELYDINFIEKTDMQILTYEEGNDEWKFVTMTQQSAMRYVEPIKRMMLESPDYQESHFIGNFTERRKAPLEELVRYNSLNPMYSWSMDCRLR